MTETVLWTNSAPSISFSASSIDLGETILNYDLLRVKVRLATSNNLTLNYYFSTSDLYGSNLATGVCFFLGASSSSDKYARQIWVAKSTPSILRMNDKAVPVSAVGGTSSSNYAYPVEVAGVKIS